MKIFRHFFSVLLFIAWNASFGSVTFYNVGQGNCTVVKSPSKKVLVVDAGSSNTIGVLGIDEPKYASLARKIADSIREDVHASKWLWFVVSHPDKDHLNLIKMIIIDLNILRDPDISGITRLLPGFNAGILLGGKAPLYSGKDSKELLDFLIKTNIKHKFGKTDCTLDSTSVYHISNDGSPILEEWDESVDGKVDFLSLGSDAPSAKALTAEENTNAASIVIKIQIGPFSVMLTGDKTKREINGLMQKLEALTALSVLKSDILLATHHGSLEDYVDEWSKSVNPAHVIFSSGRSFDHPRSEAFRGYCESLQTAPLYSWHFVQFQGDLINYTDHRYFKSLIQETPRSLDKRRGYIHALTNQNVFVTANQGDITFYSDGRLATTTTLFTDFDLSSLPVALIDRFLGSSALLDGAGVEIEEINFDETPSFSSLLPTLATLPSLASLKKLSIKSLGLADADVDRVCTLIRSRTDLTNLDLTGNRFDPDRIKAIQEAWGHRGLRL